MAEPSGTKRRKRNGTGRDDTGGAAFARPSNEGAPPSPTLAGVSDSALWKELRSRGTRSHASQRAFAGLIPEAARRLLHERPGYGSVVMLARRMGGLHESSVKEVLRLDRQLANRPRLRALLETGRAGWSKLRAVAAVATVADEAEWAHHVETLSKEALEALVRARRHGLAVEAPSAEPLTGAPPSPGVRAGTGAGAAAASGTMGGTTGGRTKDSANGMKPGPGSEAPGGPGPRPAPSAGGTLGGATNDAARDAARESARSSTEEAPLDEGDVPASSEVPAAGSGLLPEDHHVNIRLLPRAAELLHRMASHLRKNLRSTMSMSDVVETLVQGYSDAKVRPLQYCEVIVRREAGGAAHCRTRYGDVRVDEEILARGQTVRPPVDLEQARRECKARVEGGQSSRAEAAREQGACEQGTCDQGATTAAPSGDADPGRKEADALSAPPQGEPRSPLQAQAQDPPRPSPLAATSDQAGPKPAAQRHIPAHVKDYLELQYGGFCAFPRCRRPAAILHHVNRFALNPSHDPDGIVPLCKAHEELAHAGLIENEQGPPQEWRVRRERKVTNAQEAAVARVDAEVAGHRRTGARGDATGDAAGPGSQRS